MSDSKRPSDDDSEAGNKHPRKDSILSLRIPVVVEKLNVKPGTNCSHHVVRFPDSPLPVFDPDYQPKAKQYRFKLDEFQSRSVQCLDSDQSVLVAAHTSAGKTVVAEYAIALGIQKKHRVIYTSPIKALSNQKYRDLSDEFKDVGLMTGDITLNPTASVMVMTTEILRSMLYRGNELIQEMKCVIFDEIHYMRDRDRGVVWEETIIMLPDTVVFVFLSATLSNTTEFAEWICRIKHQPCHVIYTDYRPTPLQHYLFPANGDGIFMVLDEHKNFKQQTFHQALDVLSANKGSFDKKRSKFRANPDIAKIVSMCENRNYTPIIIFCFSKSECEANATHLKQVDITNDEEKKMIDEIFQNAMATLADEDRKLPQTLSILPMLKRGIGIHHGGLLPIIKEVIEILFQESLLRVLFSTETFSMGINMPAKTVVFTNLTKWDGRTRRIITSGEYIQMAGRAGRRGLDDRGLVIIMIDESIKPDEMKKIFLGDACRLDSKFYLGYNMLVNLIRTEGATPEYMIERSFHQFQRDKSMMQMKEQLKKASDELAESRNVLKTANIPEEEYPNFDVNTEIEKYYENRQKIAQLREEYREIITNSENVLDFINLGRFVKLVDSKTGVDWGWGMCFGSARVKVRENKKVYIIDCLVSCSVSSINNQDPPQPSNIEMECTFQVVPFTLDCISEWSQIKMKIDNSFRVTSFNSQVDLRHKFNHVIKKFRGNDPVHELPLLDPIKHMNIDDPRIDDILKEIKKLEAKQDKSPLVGYKHFDIIYEKYMEYIKLKNDENKLRDEFNLHNNIVLSEELKAMKNVLIDLNYISTDGIVTYKGRVACEINASDEIITTELLFCNFFEDAAPEYICAFLSCLVHEEKGDFPIFNDSKLMDGFSRIQEMASNVGNVMVKHNVGITVEEYMSKFKPTLMLITLRWARGETFTEILADSSEYEGSIIRSFRRLDELLRQLACACRSIGNLAMEQNFLDAMVKLKRGIAFSSSLYL